MQIFILLFGMAGITCAILAYLNNNDELYLGSAILLWCIVIFYGFMDYHERIILLLLAFTIFVFLLDRPVLDYIAGNRWINESISVSGKVADPVKTLQLLMLSLLGLLIGAWFAGNTRELCIGENPINENGLGLYRLLSLMVFIFTYSFAFARGLEKVVFRMSHSYLEYYTVFQSKLPYITYTFSSFNKYSMCFFLAGKPSKKSANVVLLLYLVLQVCDLIVGIRGGIVIAVFFCFFYYVFREYCDFQKKWIGNLEKAGLLVGSVPSIAFLSYYNYIRAGANTKTMNLATALYNLFYSQSVTFSWVSIGLGLEKEYPKRLSYSFGQVIDYIMYGSLGQRLFGTSPMSSGNSLFRATNGNSLAHHLSYLVFKNSYLEGRGTGSSYLLENYLDFGTVGILILALLTGWIAIKAMRYAQKSYFFSVLCLIGFSGFIYMPRSDFSAFFSFLVYLQFWVITIAICMGKELLQESGIPRRQGNG